MHDFEMKLTGDTQTLRMFEGLPAAAQNRVLKPTMREGAATLALLIRAEAPTQSGLMQIAIGATALRTYTGGLLFVTAGVRRGFRRAVQGTNYRGGWARRLRYFGKQRSADYPELPVQDPVKYLHLVTGGRKAISAVNKKVLYDPRRERFLGKSVAAAQPNPFVDRAFASAKTTVTEKLTASAGERIAAEAHSLAQ